MLSGCRRRTSPSLGNIAALGVKRGRFRGEIRPSERETERIIKWEKENEVKEGNCGRRGLFNRFKKSPIIPRRGRRERLFACPEGWDVTTESVVSEIVAGTSARTSFFILMVASSVSFAFSDFSTVLSTPLLSHLFVSLVSSAGDSTVAPLSAVPSWSLPLLVFALLIPVTAASSSCSCRLDSFLLSWRERLNSLRPLFAPDSLSSFLDLVVATSRPPTAETVAVEIRVSHSFQT